MGVCEALEKGESRETSWKSSRHIEHVSPRAEVVLRSLGVEGLLAKPSSWVMPHIPRPRCATASGCRLVWK